CRRTAAVSRLIDVDGGAYCPEHVFECAAGHNALRAKLCHCAVSGDDLCDQHVDTCSCSRVVARELILPSAASRRNTCPSCQVACVDCGRFFLEEETGRCGLSREATCLEDLCDCGHAGCDLRIRRSKSLDFE